MRRSNEGLDRASPKKRPVLRRRLGLEALEPKVVLNAEFGFVDVPGGFAFQITGTDFNQTTDTPLARADNVVIWTNTTGGISTNYFVEWQDNSGTWHSLAGSVTAGDIANEASDRGLVIGDFKGFLIKANGGDDVVSAAAGSAGTGTGGQIGVHPNAEIPLTDITQNLIGERLTVDGNGGNDTLLGSVDDDTLRGGAGNDTIEGMAGNDIIMGGAGDDVLDGGSGDDTIDGDDGHDVITGGAGNDDLDGGAGNDTISGGTGDDALEGGSGNDDLRGDEGSDDLSGGSGDDSLLGDARDKNPSGGDGFDAYQAGPTNEGIATDPDGNPLGRDGDIMIFNDDIERVDTTGADPGEPTADSGGNRFNRPGPFGTFGPFNGWDYVDSMNWTGPTGAGGIGVWIRTGEGNDTQVGSMDVKDDLRAGPGNDTIAGLGGNDTIRGGTGDDYISGGAGADDISGGDGGANDDAGDGPNGDTASYGPFTTVKGKVVPGSPEAVKVDLKGRLDWLDGNDDDDGPDFGKGGDAEGDLLRDFNGSAARDRTDNSIENLVGSDFDDMLWGDVDDNKIDGGGGDDMIDGREGEDTLIGGDGDDFLRGNDDPEELVGGKGEDTLLGGGGDDLLDGGNDDDLIDGEAGFDGVTGGKGDDTIRMRYDEFVEYDPGLGDDISNNPSAPPPLQSGDVFWDGEEVDDIIFVGGFGNEGSDIFEISGTNNTADRLDVASELAFAETFGLSDFENNEDILNFS